MPDLDINDNPGEVCVFCHTRIGLERLSDIPNNDPHPDQTH